MTVPNDTTVHPIKRKGCPKCKGDLRLYVGAKKWACLRCERTFNAIPKAGAAMIPVEIVDPRLYVVRYRHLRECAECKSAPHEVKFFTELEARTLVNIIRDTVTDLGLFDAPAIPCVKCGMIHLESCNRGERLDAVADMAVTRPVE